MKCDPCGVRKFMLNDIHNIVIIIIIMCARLVLSDIRVRRNTSS